MLPNSSVNVNSSPGVDVAMHELNSKKYQNVILAGPLGHLIDSLPTYIAWVNDCAFAQNKHHISILNGSGSGKLVKLHKLFPANIRVATVTGVSVRFDILKITAHSGGTLITPEKMDTVNDDIPSQVSIRTGATSVTEGNRFFGYCTTNEEIGATMALNLGFTLQQQLNLLFESNRIQEVLLREGEGLSVKQITTSTVGTYGWLLVFTVE